MTYDLTKEQKAMRDAAADYATNRIAPFHETDELEGKFRKEIVKEMGELGFWGTIIPEEYGGTNAGYLSSILITEAIAKVSPAYAGNFLTQTVGPGLAILKNGNEKQKRKYLPRLVTAELLGCFAVTEANAGSDIASMEMSASEMDDGYVLCGVKTWITNASESDIGLVFAYTDKAKIHHGISAFIVDMKNNERIKTTEFDKLGQRCSKVGEIIFNEAKVPKDSLLGEKGEGFKIVMGLLGNTRLFAAARGIGVAEACLDKCIDYAKKRKQFGKSIGEFQMIQEQIAEIFINLQAAKSLVYQAAANKDKGVNDILEVAAAKNFACETSVKAADVALKIYGAYGYSMEYPIQRYVRDTRGFIITEGSSNIQKMIIARQLLKSTI